MGATACVAVRCCSSIESSESSKAKAAEGAADNCTAREDDSGVGCVSESHEEGTSAAANSGEEELAGAWLLPLALAVNERVSLAFVLSAAVLSPAGATRISSGSRSRAMKNCFPSPQRPTAARVAGSPAAPATLMNGSARLLEDATLSACAGCDCDCDCCGEEYEGGMSTKRMRMSCMRPSKKGECASGTALPPELMRRSACALLEAATIALTRCMQLH